LPVQPPSPLRLGAVPFKDGPEVPGPGPSLPPCSLSLGRCWRRMGVGNEGNTKQRADLLVLGAHLAESGSPAVSPVIPRVTSAFNHLPETYQIPTLRQEKKCFIYKPIRVFADNCECQILGRDDKVQRLLGPELGQRGGGCWRAPWPPPDCPTRGGRELQSPAAAHGPIN
jgi:hypothetical protein